MIDFVLLFASIFLHPRILFTRISLHRRAYIHTRIHTHVRSLHYSLPLSYRYPCPHVLLVWAVRRAEFQLGPYYCVLWVWVNGSPFFLALSPLCLHLNVFLVTFELLNFNLSTLAHFAALASHVFPRYVRYFLYHYSYARAQSYRRTRPPHHHHTSIHTTVVGECDMTGSPFWAEMSDKDGSETDTPTSSCMHT